MIAALIEAISNHFGPDRYLFWTRVEGSVWTLADFIIVFMLIRIANVLRSFIGRRPHIGAYLLLAATIPFALILPIAPNGTAIFRLELALTIPHFLLILYVCKADTQVAAEALALRQRLKSPRPGSGVTKH